VLRVSKTCPLLGTLLLAFAFPVLAQTYAGDTPQVVVSVYDDAGVPAGVLVQAEQQAARIFDLAGVDIVWKNCSSSANHVSPDALVRAGGQGSPGSMFEKKAGLRPAGRVGAHTPASSSLDSPDCTRFDWPTHLAVRVVPQFKRSTNEVFGVAFLSAEGTGCYSDVFYDRATELQTAWKVRLPDILGNVMAHELGHLLLGSNSHARTGIMRARWQGEELSLAARGGLLFTMKQSERMRAKLVAARPPLAVTAHSSY
jgi:hypothetical protein